MGIHYKVYGKKLEDIHIFKILHRQNDASKCLETYNYI